MIIVYAPLYSSNTVEMLDLSVIDYIDVGELRVKKNEKTLDDGKVMYFFIFDSESREEAFEFLKFARRHSALDCDIRRVDNIAFVVEITYKSTAKQCLAITAILVGVSMVAAGLAPVLHQLHTVNVL